MKLLCLSIREQYKILSKGHLFFRTNVLLIMETRQIKLWNFLGKIPRFAKLHLSGYNFKTRKKRKKAPEERNDERIKSGGKGRKAKLAKETILFARKVIQWAYPISNALPPWRYAQNSTEKSWRLGERPPERTPQSLSGQLNISLASLCVGARQL